VKLFSTEVHENPFSGGRVTACGQTGKVQHISAASNAMLSHIHPLPVLITYFRNKLIPVSEPKSTIPLVSKPLNPLNSELNPIFHPLTLLGARHILHVNRIRVNSYEHR
jgi:hypothetical protein